MESSPRTPLSVGQQVPLTHKFVEVLEDEGNEENALNFANTPRSLKRSKANTPAREYCQSDIVLGNDPPEIQPTFSQDSDGVSDFSVSHLKGWLDDFGKQNREHYVKNHLKGDGLLPKGPSGDSDTESELTVARLKGWLDDFGKQNKAHYSKVNHIGKAPSGVALAKPASRCKSVPVKQTAVPPKPVRRQMDPAVTATEAKKGPAKTPVRYKPRYKKDEVQATNEGYASVQKLAAWLADDPTSDKKTKTVRRGINVINKSRLFEKDLEDVIIEENRIIKGSVSRKSQQFQSGFVHDGEDRYETASCVSVSDKKKWLQGAFAKHPIQEEEEADDDSIVSMSVLDKKKWLQSAFNSTESGRNKSQTPSRFAKSTRAESAPGGPSMMSGRDEAAVNSVKQMFQERSASRRALLDTSEPSEVNESHTEEESPTATKRKWKEHVARRTSMQGESQPAETMEVKRSQPAERAADNQAPVSNEVKCSSGQKGSFPQGARVPIEKRVPLEPKGFPPAEETKNAAEEEENFGFSAARQKLLQRSAQNGNPVTVLSKVQKRKEKFEKLQQEMRRASAPMGLLKPTWEQADPSVGPRTAYTKNFVDNVAPKKSFHQLP